MKITVAESAGFCFGVKRAVETTYALLDRPQSGKICILGHLIHNPHILCDIEAKGATTISEQDIDRLADKASEDCPITVVIRAHGITKGVFDKLTRLTEHNPYFHVQAKRPKNFVLLC